MRNPSFYVHKYQDCLPLQQPSFLSPLPMRPYGLTNLFQDICSILLVFLVLQVQVFLHLDTAQEKRKICLNPHPDIQYLLPLYYPR